MFELIIESVIVVADNFCCIHIFSTKFLKAILSGFDVRFHTIESARVMSVLTVQNTHWRALLFIDNRKFNGFLHKQN